MPKSLLQSWFWVTRLSWSGCLRTPKRKSGQGNRETKLSPCFLPKFCQNFESGHNFFKLSHNLHRFALCGNGGEHIEVASQTGPQLSVWLTVRCKRRAIKVSVFLPVTVSLSYASYHTSSERGHSGLHAHIRIRSIVQLIGIL